MLRAWVFLKIGPVKLDCSRGNSQGAGKLLTRITPDHLGEHDTLAGCESGAAGVREDIQCASQLPDFLLGGLEFRRL